MLPLHCFHVLAVLTAVTEVINQHCGQDMIFYSIGKWSTSAETFNNMIIFSQILKITWGYEVSLVSSYRWLNAKKT